MKNLKILLILYSLLFTCILNSQNFSNKEINTLNLWKIDLEQDNIYDLA